MNSKQNESSIMNKLTNEKGSTLVGALIMVVLMGYMGASLLNLGGSDTTSGTNEMQVTQALQVGNGGIQYALDKINQGLSPVVTDQALGVGTFSVAADTPASTVTVTGRVGNARKVQTLDVDYSSSCVALEVAGAYISSSGKSINGVEVIKSCNAKATITTMSISWNWGACSQALVCNGNTVSSPATADPASNKVTICHIPPGNPGNAHTITVGASAVPAHQANHGDALGACPGTASSGRIVCEGYDAQVAACGVNDGGARLKSFKLSGSFLLNGGSVVSGSLIDVPNTDLVTNGSYMLEPITWDTAIPAGSWQSITINFSDGSTLTKSFKFGS